MGESMTQLGDGIEEFVEALGGRIVEFDECREQCARWLPNSKTLEICSLICPTRRAKVMSRVLSHLDP